MLKRLLILVCCTAGLSACLPAAFVGGAATGAIVVRDRDSLKAAYEDNEIRHHVNEAIVRNPAFSKSHIVVSSFHKSVLLAGQTETHELRKRAEQMARNEPGVKRVYNEIVLGNPTSTLTRSSDALITTKVKSAMLASQGFKSGETKVVTENGTVFLLGNVSVEQAKDAVEIARHVDGVQKVVKIFNYISTTEQTA